MRANGRFTRRQLVAAALLLPLGMARAGTAPPEVHRELDGARLQGSGRLRFIGLAIYEARLWTLAPVASAAWTTSPLALEIEYARSLSGQKIAERSLDEMRRQGDITAATAERWLGAMKSLFPDVREGDRITGVFKPGESLRFFVNGALKGEVRDAEFARTFVGIWLSPRSSEPALRQALFGAPHDQR